MKRFCPKCGKETEKFYENLCKNCFLSKISLIKKLPSSIILRKCKFCEKIFINNKAANSVEDALDLMFTELLKRPEVHSATYRIENNRVHVNLILKAGELQRSEERTLNLIVKGILCKSCSMKSTGYYQAILQIRSKENLLDAILSEVENQINFLNQYDNLAFISKLEKKPEGFDAYVGSKQAARQIAKNLKNKFRANIKISRKLSGSIRGKRVYRDTILVAVGE